ncbi:sodium:calcium antiporter [Pseudodesulfovibrio cashew]|uniref:Sodium:calcium antiporter n=1 Tax=Pseudodesulfovibrio cashew TaxID=2678688 RepID=A0A6I6JQJ0_9BACT|nr:cache domain-containing protein [Pseudodesulfovibrio cashew]QGY39924.1 sodium:calcium antiporter [Pseudodesulfovibrio cashew]
MKRITVLIAGLVAAILLIASPAWAEAQTRKRAIRPDAKLAVDVVADGLGGLLSGVEDREEQIRLVRAFITPVRFFPDGSGYYFVYDYSGVCIAHGTQPELVGMDLLDMRDKAGIPVIRKIIGTARAGGGFIEYYWEEPGLVGTHEKISYVKPIRGTDFIIGTGIYFINLR